MCWPTSGARAGTGSSASVTFTGNGSMSASSRSCGIQGRRCWNWGSPAIVFGVWTGAIGVLCASPNSIHSRDVFDLKISVRMPCSSVLLRA